MKHSMLFNTKFDFVFSLGENCAAAHYLQRLKLREMSCPFDWLCNASIQTRSTLLIDRFDGFLTRENMVLMEKPLGGDPLNDYYHDKKTGFYFFHDFSKGLAFDEAYLKVKEKYDRRIARLYKKLSVSSKVLLVWVNGEYNVDKSEFVDVINRLKKGFPSIEFHLLVIENDMGRKKIDEQMVNANIIIFKGPFRPNPQLTWGDKSLFNLVFARINSSVRSYLHLIRMLMYRRVKTQGKTIYYFMNFPVFWHKRKRIQ